VVGAGAVTFAPATLVALGRYWTAQGGVNLGVVGDTRHQAKGVSYHLGASALLATAYSAQTARDKAGLTDAASAIDLGRLGGSFAKLREFSVWLVAEGQKDAPGTSDIREIIYSPDGKAVLRWDRERGFASAPRPGEADASHLAHTHVSWYRDSAKRDKTTVFRRFFELSAPVEPPDTSTAPRVRVEGSFWDYSIGGGGTITRTSRTTAGFSGTVGPISEIAWGGKPRRFVKLTSGALTGHWLDLNEVGIVKLSP